MPDVPGVPPSSGNPSSPQAATTDFNIGQEFSGAKRTLPPARIVLACIAAVAVIVAIYGFLNRAKPQGAGQIDAVHGVEVAGQSRTMVAITLTLQNSGDRPLWIHTLKAKLTAADGSSFEDEAASAVDFDRYFQAFPALKENARPALTPEAKLLPGARQEGTVVVSFPVTKDVFDQRKSIAVTIQPYDQPLPIVLTQ